MNKTSFDECKSLILPEADQSNNFTSTMLKIDHETEVRIKQYGILLELYYIYTYYKLLVLNNNRETPIGIERRLSQLDKRQGYYEDILLLKFTYYDLLLSSESLNSKIIDFIRDIICKIVFAHNDELNNEEYVLREFNEIGKNFLDNIKQNEIIKIITKCNSKVKTSYKKFLEFLFNIISCIDSNYEEEQEKAKTIAVLAVLNQKIKDTKDFKTMFDDFREDCIITSTILNDEIISIQQSIIEINNNSKTISNSNNKRFKGIGVFIDKLPSKLRKDYCEEGARCVAIGEDDQNKYISFSGSEGVENKLKDCFETIINKNYDVAYLDGGVRCYYDNLRYKEYRDIKEVYNASAGRDSNSDIQFLIKRACSCCERKLLNKLNNNCHIKIIVKLHPCQICTWAINDMAKKYTIYYNLLNKTDIRIIQSINDIFNM